jgi:anti-sigma-K factor RskA
MSTHELREQAAAYALGALEPAEAEAFEAGLAADPELQRLVDGYRQSLLAVADAVPKREPPAALRERVLARARAERSGAGTPRPEPTPSDPRDAPPGTGSRAQGSGGRGRGAAPWILLAASLAGLAWVGLRNVELRARAAALATEAARLEATIASDGERLARLDTLLGILSGPDVRYATLTGDDAPTLRLVWNTERAQLLVAASGLPEPEPGRTYQLWGIRTGETPVSLGLFEPGPDGTALLTLSAADDAAFDVSAVTDEPDGGSPQPTTQPFLVGAWSAAPD